jgi:hypothetical protein
MQMLVMTSLGTSHRVFVLAVLRRLMNVSSSVAVMKPPERYDLMP